MCQKAVEPRSMDHIGAQLAKARTRAGLTQLEMARKLGIAQSRISRIERQANPRMDTVQSYARALGLEIVLVPRTHLSRVHVMLSDKPARLDDEGGSWRFPSLADLIADASETTNTSPQTGS
jgi:transcriptional regulator with XRE-family HTH domain